MAHFKRGNLQLKTNQQIQLGDSQESVIQYDGVSLTLDVDGSEVLNLTSTGQTLGVSGDVELNLDQSADTITFQVGGGNEMVLGTSGLTLETGATVNEISNDGTLSSDSTSTLVTEQAAKGYVDNYQHNNLQSLQGGNGSDEFYHLTAQIHDQISSDATSVIFSNDVQVLGDLFTSGNSIYVGAGGVVNAGANSLTVSSTGGNSFITVDDDDNNGAVTIKGSNDLSIEINTANIGGADYFAFGDLVNWDKFLFFDIGNGSFEVYMGDGSNSYLGITDSGGANLGDVTQNHIWITNSHPVESNIDLKIQDVVKARVNEEGITISGKTTTETLEITSSDSTALVVAGDIHCNDLYVSGNSIILGSTYLTETGGGGLTVAGDLVVTGDLSLTGTMPATDVEYNNITPSTYNTVQDGMDTLGSAGLISGGIITSDGTAAVNVTAGTGMLRISNNQFADIEFIDFAEATSLQIADDETQNVVVYYNGGSPEIQVVNIGTTNVYEYFILGQVGRAGDELFISNLRQRISNFAIRSLARMNGTEAVARNGNVGLIIGESGDSNRYVTMTSGEVWTLLDIELISTFNSGITDIFTTVYRDTPSGYVETPGETQWPADDYDDGSGTLQSLSNGRYGVRWFWYIPSSADMVMVYGTGNWKSLAEAEAEPVPTEVPGIITEYGVLIGKIICQKNVNIAAEVSSAFEETYNFSAATTHGNLSNLAAPYDDHTQYSHIDGRRDFTGTVGGVDPVASTDFTTLDYMSKLGTPTQRLSYDSTTGDLDISIEHIVDVKYTDFDITEDAPPWQEGRVFWDKESNTFGVYNDVSDVTLQVGQETHIKIRNETGDLIPNGSMCHISGSSQERATVELADASDQEKTEGLVVVTHDLAHNTNGYGTIIGMVRGIDTMGFSDGEEIYLSETNPGAFRSGRPSAPDYVVDVGFVITGDSTADGEILVSFINHGDFATLADVNIPAPPTSGQTLVYSKDDMYWQPETQIKVISYTLPLTGVVDAVVPLTGSFVTKASGVTGDDATDYAISNQHVWILINSVTGADSTGTITVTGTSLSESTAVPVPGDTEEITIDSTSGVYYQTNKKWWEITNIAISGDISAINYDHGSLGYPDLGNRNFKILGYRMDAFASGNTPDLRIIISKVNDLGNNRVELVDLEDIGVDSGAAENQIVDHIRTGGNDRSFNPAVSDVWLNNETFTFKQLDFDTYWSNDENEIDAAEGNSGYFIRFEGEPDGITNVDFVNLLLYYALL